MKTVKKTMMALLALLALASCAVDDNEVVPENDQLLKALSGHWYAEVPISGETDNWRTEEAGDKAAFNKIGALIYLNGYVTSLSYWGYLYLQDGDMVNFDGIDRMKEDAAFDFTMNSEGDIVTSSHLPNAPKIANMHWDRKNDVLTADVSFNGHTLAITFTRPVNEQEETLNDFFEMLVEAGMVAYDDENWQIKTDISNRAANETARSRQQR